MQAIYAHYLALTDAAAIEDVAGLFDGTDRMVGHAAGHLGYLGG